jgi:hypothetical protein
MRNRFIMLAIAVINAAAIFLTWPLPWAYFIAVFATFVLLIAWVRSPRGVDSGLIGLAIAALALIPMLSVDPMLVNIGRLMAFLGAMLELIKQLELARGERRVLIEESDRSAA